MTVRSRRLVLALVALSLVVTALAVASLTRDQHRAAAAVRERTVAATALARTTRALARATTVATAKEDLLALTVHQRDSLDALAATLRTQLDQVRAARDGAALNALATGAKAGMVAECLQGVQQALNQLSVGDRSGLGSLQHVAGPCREAAA